MAKKTNAPHIPARSRPAGSSSPVRPAEQLAKMPSAHEAKARKRGLIK